MPDVKELIEEFQRDWQEYKRIIDAFGTESAEAKERLEKMDQRFDEIEEKLAALETKLNRPEPPGKTDAPEVKAFLNWVRKGELAPDEKKLLSSDVGPSGGYLIPALVRDRIVEKLIEISPIRSLASNERLTVGDTYEYVIENDVPSAGWTSERATRSETSTGTNPFGVGRIPIEEMYAEPKVTQKLLDDAGFDVENWLVNRLAKVFAQLEGQAFVSGDGVGKPRGILSHPSVSEVKTGDASTITADSLIEIAESLPEQFDTGARWLMRKATRAVIRKLKDNNGQYLWQPGLGAEPSTLLGYPITITPDMPTVAANAYPIVFGNIAEGYLIVDKPGIALIRDVITQKGFVIFYTTRRVGGDVVNPNAILKLKVAA